VRLRVVLVGLLGIGLLGVVHTPAGAHAAPKLCVDLDLSYGLHTATPGTIFDFEQGLVNCSDHCLRIRVKIDASGPCPFARPGSSWYTLDAGGGVFATGLFIERSCPGHYRVMGRALVHGVVVDRAHAGFTVRAQ
jgi:hypothetical protein